MHFLVLYSDNFDVLSDGTSPISLQRSLFRQKRSHRFPIFLLIMASATQEMLPCTAQMHSKAEGSSSALRLQSSKPVFHFKHVTGMYTLRIQCFLRHTRALSLCLYLVVFTYITSVKEEICKRPRFISLYFSALVVDRCSLHLHIMPQRNIFFFSLLSTTSEMDSREKIISLAIISFFPWC